MISFLFTTIVLLLLNLVSAEVTSPSHNYNVTLPEPNAPYVAGQMLPISYTIPDEANLPSLLQLSVLFTTQDSSLNFTETVITSNADISQGFSFRRTHNTYVYCEHQLSYAIPNTTLPGNYIVLFVDSVSKTNTSVPIMIRPYAAPVPSPTNNLNKARPSGGGSIFAIHSSDANVYTTSRYIMIAVACLFLVLI